MNLNDAFYRWAFYNRVVRKNNESLHKLSGNPLNCGIPAYGSHQLAFDSVFAWATGLKLIGPSIVESVMQKNRFLSGA
jgi:hypothetical protein